MRSVGAVVGLMILMSASSVFGQRSQSVTLGPRGSGQYMDTVEGRQYVDYRVRVGAGQSLTVSLKPRNVAASFNVVAPKSGAVMYDGRTSGNDMSSRVIPFGGEYTIRVYRAGATASGNRLTEFVLSIRVRGSALRPLPSSKDARLRGTPYHARGIVQCALADQRERYRCDAYVIRYGGGSATVEFRAGRLTRRVLFVKGRSPVGDSSEALTYDRSGDDTVFRFGDGPSEEYSVPDAFVFGG